MKKTLLIYHGSQMIIERPTFGKGNTNNDYGLGFYCTETLELAKEWACSSETSGYANIYKLDTDGLSVLCLSDGNYNILNWLSILLENRKFRISGDIAIRAKEYISKKFMPEYQSYDIIKGYRADDSYFSFAAAFLNNTISLAQLERAMILGKLGEQIVAKSEKSFNSLSYIESMSADKKLYYPKKLARDNGAREEFRKEKSRTAIENEIYILDIIRERWDNDDARLQRIVLG